jgi:hypothetical protein
MRSRRFHSHRRAPRRSALFRVAMVTGLVQAGWRLVIPSAGGCGSRAVDLALGGCAHTRGVASAPASMTRKQTLPVSRVEPHGIDVLTSTRSPRAHGVARRRPRPEIVLAATSPSASPCSSSGTSRSGARRGVRCDQPTGVFSSSTYALGRGRSRSCAPVRAVCGRRRSPRAGSRGSRARGTSRSRLALMQVSRRLRCRPFVVRGESTCGQGRGAEACPRAAPPRAPRRRIPSRASMPILPRGSSGSDQGILIRPAQSAEVAPRRR